MEKPLILLVDDNPKNLQVLGSLLEGTYKTAVAENGAEALEFVKKRFPDLILLDILMPEIDGFEVCERLKALPETRDIPIIFLSAKTETQDIVKGFEVGGVDYITKPFHAPELLVRVHTHIELRQKTLILQSIADRDGLTMIPNRRRFDEFLDLEWRRCLREQTTLAFIMIDIDWFKRYNDLYGHLQGDECLKQIAQTIGKTVRRPTDFAARFGGEEFAVVLGNTGVQQAMMIAENIRTAIEGLQIPHNASEISHVVTISLGVATVIPDAHTSPEDLINAADERLYEAKNAGRNQVRYSL